MKYNRVVTLDYLTSNGNRATIESILADQKEKRMRALLTALLVFACLHVVLFNAAMAQSAQDDPVAQASAALIEGDAAALEAAINTPGFDITAQVNEHYGLLHVAASIGDPTAVRALLAAGADIDAVDGANGWTALMIAIYQGHRTVAAQLKDKGADVNVVGQDRSTASVLARYSGMSHLFATGAKPQKRDRASLNRMLLMSAEAGDIEVARRLLEQGADPYTLSDAGWTPILYAAFRRDRKLYELLTDAADRPTDMDDWAMTLPQAVLMGAAASPGASSVTVGFLKKLEREAVDIDDKGGSTIGNRELAERYGLAPSIIALFAEPAEPDIELGPLPEVEVVLRPDMNTADWSGVQTVFARHGLYSAAIDGKPGSGTRRGLLAYYATILPAMEKEGRSFCDRAAEAYQEEMAQQTLAGRRYKSRPAEGQWYYYTASFRNIEVKFTANNNQQFNFNRITNSWEKKRTELKAIKLERPAINCKYFYHSDDKFEFATADSRGKTLLAYFTIVIGGRNSYSFGAESCDEVYRSQSVAHLPHPAAGASASVGLVLHQPCSGEYFGLPEKPDGTLTRWGFSQSRRSSLSPSPSPPQSQPQPQSVSRGDWFVILGSWPHNGLSGANDRLRQLQARGIEAHIINTDNYSNLSNGLVAVVVGPYSRSGALGLVPDLQKVVGDAYAKAGR